MLEKVCEEIQSNPLIRIYGRVQRVRQDSVHICVPNVKVGSICDIHSSVQIIPVEVVSLSPEGHVAMPLDGMDWVKLGDPVFFAGEPGHAVSRREPVGAT